MTLGTHVHRPVLRLNILKHNSRFINVFRKSSRGERNIKTHLNDPLHVFLFTLLRKRVNGYGGRRPRTYITFLEKYSHRYVFITGLQTSTHFYKWQLESFLGGWKCDSHSGDPPSSFFKYFSGKQVSGNEKRRSRTLTSLQEIMRAPSI